MKAFYKDAELGLGGDQTIGERMNGLRDLLAISKGKTVLDIGCAEGLVCNEFMQQGATVTGIDSRVHAIDIANKCFPCGQFIHTPIQNYRNEEKFDIVLLLAILQKLHPDDQIDALVKAVELTKEYIAVRVPENYLLPLECIYPMKLAPISHHHDLDSKRVGSTRVFRIA